MHIILLLCIALYTSNAKSEWSISTKDEANKLIVNFTCDEIHMLRCVYTDVAPIPSCSIWIKEESGFKAMKILNSNIGKDVYFLIDSTLITAQQMVHPFSATTFMIEHVSAQMVHGEICPGVRTQMQYLDLKNETAEHKSFFNIHGAVVTNQRITRLFFLTESGVPTWCGIMVPDSLVIHRKTF